jgi:hypothetical protein
MGYRYPDPPPPPRGHTYAESASLASEGRTFRLAKEQGVYGSRHSSDEPWDEDGSTASTSVVVRLCSAICLCGAFTSIVLLVLRHLH